MCSKVCCLRAWEWRANIEGLPFVALTLEEATSLQVPYREEEVFSALREMNGDKALGPNGFSLSFWQDIWHFVKEKVLGFFFFFFCYE